MGSCLCHKLELERRIEKRTYQDGKVATEDIVVQVYKGNEKDIRMKANGSFIGLGTMGFGDAKQNAICYEWS